MTLEVVILAAGQGTRMRSSRPKVLQRLAGRALLTHVIQAARALNPSRIHIVIGHQAEAVKRHFADDDDLTWVHQHEQLGTGHAVQQAMPGISDDATVLVLYGDVPLVRSETLRGCVDAAADGSIAVLTMRPADPTGLGRIIRDRSGKVTAIVEERDATAEQRAVGEVNSGILALPAAQARRLLDTLDTANAQREYLLTDIIHGAVSAGIPVSAVVADDAEELAGVNDRIQLAALERHYQHRLTAALMRDGVSFLDPARVDIRGELVAGMDCEIDVNVVFEGHVRLGDDVRIGASCVIKDASIDTGSIIAPHTVIDGASIGRGCAVGPFARLRPGTELGRDVRIGNFVEVKQASIGNGTKASHLAYLGDLETGADCNIGAGTIICNYDGVTKHRTRLGDGVFVGSNSTLVAPLEVAGGAYVAAGSTVTAGVGERELAVGRSRQRNISGWTPPAERENTEG